ncbi:MAG: hypothetical protein QS748_02765 [Candidatus Endonucleobacter bathymodioli]|uniref:Uncharacterized protein n=1 Tax=Candidatus Endonucleibacter bathymodioli TaxID=539814 RepID=A0AA90NPN2_9GAMM|nr:hypothetical protein [Candidatus Endonucleobacter bathymodioli]
MDGASRVQHAGVGSTQGLTPSSVGKSAQMGKMNGEVVRSQTNAVSALSSNPGDDVGDAEEIARSIGNKQSRKLNIKSGKGKEREVNKGENKEGARGAGSPSGTDASDFAEERASLIKSLLKKLSNEEELTDKEKDDLIDGMADDFNGAGKKLLEEVVAVMEIEQTKEEVRSSTDDIRELKRLLEVSEKNGTPVDKDFWKGLGDLSSRISPKIMGKVVMTEASKEFIDTPKKLLDDLESKFKNADIKQVVALRVKEIGVRVDQSGNDKIRLQANITELLTARVFLSIVDACDEIAMYYNRMDFSGGQEEFIA